MPKNNPPEKRRARALQRETGQPYQTCLDQARAEIAAEQGAVEPEPAAPIVQPTSDGLFSHA